MWRLKHLVLGCVLLGLALWQITTGTKLTFGLGYLEAVYFVSLGLVVMLGTTGVLIGFTRGGAAPSAKGTFDSQEGKLVHEVALNRGV